MTAGQRLLRIGLTGGIGSGKSTVAKAFAALGVPVIDADQIARQLVEPGEPALTEIVVHFGEGVLRDGHLDRAVLRQKIFADEDQRKWLEALIHPLIYAAIERECALASGPYVLVVVPLLLETGRKDLIDRLLVVDLDPELQMARVMDRDHLRSSEVDRILSTQLDRKTRLAEADDVIDNSGTPDELPSKVLALHQSYLKRAAKTLEPPPKR